MAMFTLAIQSPQDFCGLCMDLWTKIDLVQAINTDQKVRKEVLKELAKGISILCSSREKIKKPVYRSRESSTYDTIALIIALKNAFEAVFKETDSALYASSLKLLNGMIEELISPVNIEAEVTA